ncbi:tyrosine-type recombinase/integrase [Leuconostoc pseudomesenteroides]|uniref:tyrosine-type recombinase/integrase n=2 Tax=Leuconostoc TaxID=1243 RepID=UPI00301C62E4
MVKTRYTCVYQDKKGSFYYLVELGNDKYTGKRIQKKSTKDLNGKRFVSAHDAHKEVVRIKNEYLIQNGFANYELTYGEFITKSYLPHYRASVQKRTWDSRKSGLEQIALNFKDKKLRDITVVDCEKYRTWLLNESGYSQSYCSLLYGMFRKTLDYAVVLQFLSSNVSKRTMSISKGKAVVSFWTKNQFEQVLSKIYINEFYEHMCFIMIWLYYMTGIRVSEGLALNWSDIDLVHKKMFVHHTLEMVNQNNFIIKPYTKTVSGMRTISLDDDTVVELTKWKKVQAEHGIKNFVFSYTDLPMYRSTVQRIIKRYAKIANVPIIQGKGLRHSHVSYLINEFNADILVVSKRLGHSSPEITLKHYAHLWSRNDENIAEQMSGNIHFKFAEKSVTSKFNGNQSVSI